MPPITQVTELNYITLFMCYRRLQNIAQEITTATEESLQLYVKNKNIDLALLHPKHRKRLYNYFEKLKTEKVTKRIYYQYYPVFVMLSTLHRYHKRIQGYTRILQEFLNMPLSDIYTMLRLYQKYTAEQNKCAISTLAMTLDCVTAFQGQPEHYAKEAAATFELAWGLLPTWYKDTPHRTSLSRDLPEMLLRPDIPHIITYLYEAPHSSYERKIKEYIFANASVETAFLRYAEALRNCTAEKFREVSRKIRQPLANVDPLSYHEQSVTDVWYRKITRNFRFSKKAIDFIWQRYYMRIADTTGMHPWASKSLVAIAPEAWDANQQALQRVTKSILHGIAYCAHSNNIAADDMQTLARAKRIIQTKLHERMPEIELAGIPGLEQFEQYRLGTSRTVVAVYEAAHAGYVLDWDAVHYVFADVLIQIHTKTLAMYSIDLTNTKKHIVYTTNMRKLIEAVNFLKLEKMKSHPKIDWITQWVAPDMAYTRVIPF